MRVDVSWIISIPPAANRFDNPPGCDQLLSTVWPGENSDSCFGAAIDSDNLSFMGWFVSHLITDAIPDLYFRAACSHARDYICEAETA